MSSVPSTRNIVLLAVLMFSSLATVSCTTFNPQPLDMVAFREKAQVRSGNSVRVTAAVLSAEESKKIFSVNVYRRGVQPVWLEIENKSKKPVYFLPLGLSPNYFSPIEAAFVNHFAFRTSANEEMQRYFLRQAQAIRIAPGSVQAGFVYTPVHEGTKEFNVDLIGEDHESRTFTFFIEVPGLRADHHQVDFESLYPEDQIVSYDEQGLRKALESLPCCTTNKGGTAPGDPLNLVVIGDAEEVFYAFIRAGWDETETIYMRSIWKTARSFILGGRYRYSPISALYVYGRSQDVALQKARTTIHERNHLRLWLAPMRFKDKPVWVGQISRDIGVRFTRKTILTHKIDPDVDETRDFLIQDLLYSHVLTRVAYVEGVGPATMCEPRHTLTGDPYFTDGMRAVLWVSSDPIGLDDVELLNWAIPLKA